MANVTQKVSVTRWNGLEMIVYEWESANSIVMNKQGTDWS